MPFFYFFIFFSSFFFLREINTILNIWPREKIILLKKKTKNKIYIVNNVFKISYGLVEEMGRSGDDNCWEGWSAQWRDLGGKERRKERGWVLNRLVYQKLIGSIGSSVRSLTLAVRARLKSWSTLGPDWNGGRVVVKPVRFLKC